MYHTTKKNPASGTSGIELFVRGSILVKLVLLAYVCAYGGATYNHIADCMRYGFGYPELHRNVSGFVKIYWTALTFADPLAVVVLALRARLGVALYALIIVSDVAINAVVAIRAGGGLAALADFGLACQFIFMVFLLVTYRFIFRKTKPAA
jgi:hypothetical protein